MQHLKKDTMSTSGIEPLWEALKEFYRLWGHQAEVQGGCVWFDGGTFSLMSIPTTLTSQSSVAEVRSLLRRTGKLAAVYRVPSPCRITLPVYFLRDKNYDLAALSRQFRQKVRSAATRMEVRQVEWSAWEHSALPCDRDTLLRHGNRRRTSHPLLDPKHRARVAEAARATPGLALHACYCGQTIVAYLIHLSMEPICEGLFLHRIDSLSEPEARFASHLLYYQFAHEMIRRSEVGGICVGRQSIPANPSLGRFKRQAGFSEEPCHLSIKAHPLLAPLVENSITACLLAGLRHRGVRFLPILSNLEVLEKASAKSGIS